ncbi:MAG: twin-arginine translocation signal domain-containing protein [Blastocatellia bacterium]
MSKELDKTRSNHSSNKNSRRQFLRATSAAALSVASLPFTETALAQSPVPANDRQSRAERAMRIRQQAAQNQRKQPILSQPSNGDEDAYANRIGCYSKALPHDELGLVEPRAYQALLQAVTTCEQNDYEMIPLGGSVKLANPQAAMAFQLEGSDPHQFVLPPAPKFNSSEQAAEMAELYWQAVTRDVAFAEYESNSLVKQAAEDLSRFTALSAPKNGKRVLPATLFRGATPGDLTGPYLSQFLWLDVPYGALKMQQQYSVPETENDQLTDYDEWLSVVSGYAPSFGLSFDETPRYLRNGRDLAEWVHRDFSYQGFLNAALILLGYGQAAIDPYNPYLASATQDGFSTFGSPYILDLVARVANAALKAAWYQKWQIHRRIRPEEFGGHVHNQMTEKAEYDIHAELLTSPVLEIVYNQQESYLLPMAYAEGCPTHPAYPAGHATIAGACATVLKAFFNENFVLPKPVTVGEDGLSLESYHGVSLTVGGEVNKLASNIALGRDTAGVHWRSDGTEGLKLGEAVALSILGDLKATCHEQFRGLRLTKFDGATVVV